jgi:hypothetical protein
MQKYTTSDVSEDIFGTGCEVNHVGNKKKKVLEMMSKIVS